VRAGAAGRAHDFFKPLQPELFVELVASLNHAVGVKHQDIARTELQYRL